MEVDELLDQLQINNNIIIEDNDGGFSCSPEWSGKFLPYKVNFFCHDYK